MLPAYPVPGGLALLFLRTGPMPNVFISYVRQNSDQVDKLAEELRRHGVTVWKERDEIRPG